MRLIAKRIDREGLTLSLFPNVLLLPIGAAASWPNPAGSWSQELSEVRV